ncbi:hypothetical protein BDR26DRAFT_864474, partial [Obelidium mucronatum]
SYLLLSCLVAQDAIAMPEPQNLIPRWVSRTSPTGGQGATADSANLPPALPKYDGALGPPIGAYICNANQIYQLNYVTTTTVDWILLSTCDNNTVCRISMASGNDQFVGCVYPLP